MSAISPVTHRGGDRGVKWSSVKSLMSPFDYFRTVFVKPTERRAGGSWLSPARLIHYFLAILELGAAVCGTLLKQMKLIHGFTLETQLRGQGCGTPETDGPNPLLPFYFRGAHRTTWSWNFAEADGPDPLLLRHFRGAGRTACVRDSTQADDSDPLLPLYFRGAHRTTWSWNFKALRGEGVLCNLRAKFAPGSRR
jgi:hypothetical protein